MPTPHDTSPVTDSEIACALRGVLGALEVVDVLLEVATPRQVEAVFAPCPYSDYGDVRVDYAAWLGLVLDGTTGLDVNQPATIDVPDSITSPPAQPPPSARRVGRVGRTATVLSLAASLLLLGVVTVPTSDGTPSGTAYAAPTFAAQWSDFAESWQLDCRDVTDDAARCYRVRQNGTTARFSVMASRRPDGNTYSLAGGTGALLTLHTFTKEGALDAFCETLHVLPKESLRRIVVDDGGMWAIVVDSDVRAQKMLNRHEGSLTAEQWHERHGAVHGPHNGHGAF